MTGFLKNVAVKTFLKRETFKMSEGKKPEKKECRFCYQQINVLAHVCHYCGRYQQRVRQYFRFESLALLVSIAMVFLAFLQFQEARKEHIAAKDALVQATEAERQALNIGDGDLVQVIIIPIHRRKET